MAWLRRRDRVQVRTPLDDQDEWDDRSLLEIENDPEMRAAQAEVDAEPLTPRSARDPDPYSAW